MSDSSLQTNVNKEPKLSYERILNDIPNSLKNDNITSSCLHSKLFAIGTKSGRIHVSDHQGNKVNQQDLTIHLKAVKCISIDLKGEYFVSCSDDRLVVYGLCNSNHNFVIMPDRPVNSVAIDPYFYKSGFGRRFVVADDKLTLFERGFLSRYKTVQLQLKDDPVHNVSWHEEFIAWNTNTEIRIFDVEQKAVITKIKRDIKLDYPDQNANTLCRFCWKDERTLLIAWNHSIKVCLIKDRIQSSMYDSPLKEIPKKYVEIVSMFDTEYDVYGIAPFEESLLTLSLNVPENKDKEEGNLDTDNTNQIVPIRPQVNILDCFPDTYIEQSSDILTPNGFILKEHQCFTLTSLYKEQVYFIFCPKDVIVAKPRDYDDHIDWLIEHSLLKEAYLYAKEYSHKLSRYSCKDIENQYIKELRDNMEKLMEEDTEETSQILVDNIDSIPMKEVMDRLDRLPEHLLTYLHKLSSKYPDSCLEYHNLMLVLYSKYKKQYLINFLKQSTNYKLEDALRICQEAGLIKEVVYLFGRMGNLRVALKYIIESLEDIYEAIEFCKEHQDSDLWQDLILYSIHNPEFISALLKNIGTHINDPMDLIERIPSGCEIDGLMPALVKILQDYQLQISLEQSCRDIVASDCFLLLEKQMKCQTHSIMIKENQSCDHCNQPLLAQDSIINDLTSRSPSHNQIDNESSVNNIVVFGCHHVFHEECSENQSTSTPDTKFKICRICTLE